MREHTESFSREKIDLDNPEIYKHLPDNVEDLNNRMLREIGYATCYMDYWHPDIFNTKQEEPDMTKPWTEEDIALGYPDAFANSGFYQRQRVYKLIENFTANRRNNWKNIMWFKEQVFLFEDEIENMC